MPETRPPSRTARGPRQRRPVPPQAVHHRHRPGHADPAGRLEFLDRYHLRDPPNQGLKHGVKQVFSAAGASTRQFKKVQGVGKPPTRLAQAAPTTSTSPR